MNDFLQIMVDKGKITQQQMDEYLQREANKAVEKAKEAKKMTLEERVARLEKILGL